MTETAPNTAAGNESAEASGLTLGRRARASAARLPSPRRFYALVAFVLLALPMVVGVLHPDSEAYVYEEGRRLAPPPAWPTDLAGWTALPREVDAYVKDRFGLRHAMIKLHRDLSHPLVMKVNTAALTGRSGRLFYEGNEMLRQSAGQVMRDERISETVGLLAEIRDRLAKDGVKFLVTVPPNSSTIYQDDVPYWAQNHGRQTEYDLFLAELKARGIKTVDLRPALTEARKQGEVYLMNDAHWTARGAIAGFNAVAEADGHPDWAIDADDVARTAFRAKGRGHRAHSRHPGRGLRKDAAHCAAQAEDGRGADRGPHARPCRDDGQAGPDDPHHRRFLHRELFSADAGAACGARDLDSSSRMRLRLVGCRKVPSGRSLVGPDRTLPHLRSPCPSPQLSKTGCGMTRA